MNYEVSSVVIMFYLALYFVIICWRLRRIENKIDDLKKKDGEQNDRVD